MALITAAQVREHYPELLGTGEDTLLGTMITRADALMASYLGFPECDAGGKTLEDVTYTLYPDAPREEEPAAIDLGIRPVVSITSAYVDSLWSYGSDTQVAAGDMVLDARRGRIWLTPSASSAWDTFPRANKITVVAGWATTPADLVAAAAMLVAHLVRSRNTAGFQAYSGGGASLTVADPDALIPPGVQDALAPYVLGSSRAG